MPLAKKSQLPATPEHEPARAGVGARDGGSAHTLRIGTRLRDYELTQILNEAGFGIVYLAYDHSLQRQVAIKEYLPSTMVTRSAGTLFVNVRSDQSAGAYRVGLKSFLNEARLLARFDHPSLVKVYRFWEENGTAYMVMPFYDGPDLKNALAELGRVPTELELRNWLRPVLDAVTVMHEAGFFHHHIGIDNIRLTDLGPVLLDFAAARRVVEGETHTLAMSLKPGFAAIEQYGDGAAGTQGAWTDLYALGAVLYTAITGAPPMPAPERLARDNVLKLRGAAASLYSDSFLEAIDAALSLQPENRPRDHAQFRALMRDIDAPNETVALSALRDLMLEPFVLDPTRAPGETTVPNGSITDGAPPRRSRPGSLADLPSTTSLEAGRRSQPGALGDGGRNSRPGALRDGTRQSRPGALSNAADSRPGALKTSARTSRPGALNGPASTHPSRLDSLPSDLASAPSSSKKTLSPRAARIAAAHETSGEPSDLHPDVDFSASIETKAFLDRFGKGAKAGIVVVGLALIGLAVWVAKPGVDGSEPARASTAASPSTVVAPPPAAPRTLPPPSGTETSVPPVVAAPTTRTTPATAPARAPATAAADNAPITAASRQARCVEILQKVSLEPMTPADAAFYKRECQR